MENYNLQMFVASLIHEWSQVNDTLVEKNVWFWKLCSQTPFN